TLLTSRQFIEKAELGELVTQLEAHIRIVYLEDVREQIGKLTAIARLVQYSLHTHAPSLKARAEDPAVILFTSGSEGMPKGVALSHKNLLSNIAQASAVLSFEKGDRMLNALPIFHSFGLTAGTLLPLFLGIRVFFYPNPLHYKQIP